MFVAASGYCECECDSGFGDRDVVVRGGGRLTALQRPSWGRRGALVGAEGWKVKMAMARLRSKGIEKNSGSD